MMKINMVVWTRMQATNGNAFENVKERKKLAEERHQQAKTQAQLQHKSQTRAPTSTSSDQGMKSRCGFDLQYMANMLYSMYSRPHYDRLVFFSACSVNFSF